MLNSVYIRCVGKVENIGPESTKNICFTKISHIYRDEKLRKDQQSKRAYKNKISNLEIKKKSLIFFYFFFFYLRSLLVKLSNNI